MIKRIMAMLLSIMFLFSMVGCGGASKEATSSETNVASSSDTDSTTSADSSNADTDTDTDTDEDTSSNVSSSNVSSDNGSASNTSSTSKGIDMNALKGTSVKVLMWRDLTQQEEKTIANFKKETSISVEIITTNWSNYMTKLASMVSTNDAPDVAIIPTQQNAQGCFPLGTATLFQPIDVTKQDLTDDFWDIESMDKFKIKNRHFAFIAYNNWYDCHGVVLYNVDMFKDAGVTTPRELWKAGNWNWNTLRTTAAAITKKGNIGYVNEQVNNLMQSMGVDFVTYENQAFKSSITSKEVIKAWTFNAQMVEAGVQPAYGTESTSFEQGRAGMIGTNLWKMRKEAGLANVNFTVDAVPFPSPQGEETVIPANVNLFGIAKGAKNAVGAGVFIRYFLDSANNGSFAEIAVNPAMEDVFNYVTGKDIKKGYKYAIGVVGYTNLSNLKNLESTLSKTASSQITTVLQQNSSLVDNAVKTVNSKLK